MDIVTPCKHCGSMLAVSVNNTVALAAFTASGVLCEACASADRLKEKR